MRLLFFSDGMTVPSGYGQQMALLLPRLVELGHDVALVDNSGLQAGNITINGVYVFPGNSSGDQYSQSLVPVWADMWRPDVIVSVMDAFVLRPEFYPQYRHVTYFPVDTESLRPNDLPALRSAWDRICMSRDGQEKAQKAGIPSRFLPLGIDTTIYYPRDKAACRKKFGIDDGLFVVGMVAANKEPAPSRKAWYEQLAGFKLFSDRYPGKALLYIHSIVKGGTDLEKLIDRLGIRDRVVFSQQPHVLLGLPQQTMADLYGCFDAYLGATRGEGFGVPLLEAQAVGVPVITGDWSACAELQYAGVTIPKEAARLEPVYGPDQEEIYRYAPYPQAVADALDHLYHLTPEEYAVQSSVAAQQASRYDIRNLLPHWQKLLTEWQMRIDSEEKRKPTRKRPDLAGTFDAQVHRAAVTQAEVVLITPSYGERCGIAEYTSSQLFELFKAGIRAHIATTVAEAVQIVKQVPSVRSVILHHEYSLFDEGAPHLCMGESLPVVLRQLAQFKHTLSHGATAWGVYDETDALPIFRRISVGIVQHTVSPQPAYDAINRTLAHSGIPLFATSYAGANFLASEYKVPVGHCALGTWSIPKFEPWKREKEFGAPLVIGNFGMLGPQRDLPSAAEVCRRTKSEYLGSHASGDPQLMSEAKAVFEKVGVKATLLHDWPDDIEFLNRLSHCDIIYMPRKSGVYYSSASVLSAMNTRRPIIANSDPGYQDLSDVICLADTVDEAVAWVERLRDPKEYDKAVAKIDQYLAQRNVVSVLKEAGLLP